MKIVLPIKKRSEFTKTCHFKRKITLLLGIHFFLGKDPGLEPSLDLFPARHHSSPPTKPSGSASASTQKKSVNLEIYPLSISVLYMLKLFPLTRRVFGSSTWLNGYGDVVWWRADDVIGDVDDRRALKRHVWRHRRHAAWLRDAWRVSTTPQLTDADRVPSTCRPRLHWVRFRHSPRLSRAISRRINNTFCVSFLAWTTLNQEHITQQELTT